MTQIPPTPTLEKVKQRAAKVQKICQRADAEILILDELIAQLEAQNRSSSLHLYRLNKAALVGCVNDNVTHHPNLQQRCVTAD